MNGDLREMDIISKLIDTNKIVSANVNDIKIDPDFRDQHSLSTFDMNLIKSAVHVNMGMTDYQCKHFVAKSQITPYKQVRQSLMELEVRYHAYQEIRNSLRKAEISRKKMQRQMDSLEDPLDKELVQIDLEKNDYDITIWQRKLNQSQYEIRSFLNVINEYVKNEDDLDFYLQVNEEEERKYWVARMGKQAAMDVIAFGRIGSGNMDSIAMMDERDQLETLQVALQYAGMVNAGISKIAEQTQSQVNTYLNSKEHRIAQILDGINNDPDLQLTDKSKVNPESI
jgi:hypothetical protein